LGLAVVAEAGLKSWTVIFASLNGLSTRVTIQTATRKHSTKTSKPKNQTNPLHTLRHWKATMEYAKTKDLLYVKQLKGHKKFENTLKYTQLSQTLNQTNTPAKQQRQQPKPRN
jgi:site-specific recombinase XerD